MPIDLSPEEFRRLGYRAVDLLTEHFAALADGPCRSPVPDAERRALIEQPVPIARRRSGRPAGRGRLDDPALPDGQQQPAVLRAGSTRRPRRLRVLAELLAAGLNPSVAGGDHAATYVEHAALRWMRHHRPISRGQRRHPDQRRLGGEPDRPGRDAPREDRRSRAGPRDRRRAAARSSSTRRAKVTAASRRRSSCWASGTRISGVFRWTPSGGWTSRALERQIADGPGRRVDAGVRGGQRRHREHRRDRPARPHRRRVPGESSSGFTSTPRTAGRRRSSRSVARSVRRPRTRRQRRDRPAQVDVRAGRVRVRAGAGRAGDARHVLARAAVSARRHRAALVFGVRHSAEPRIQGAQAVDGAEARRASTATATPIAHDIAMARALQQRLRGRRGFRARQRRSAQRHLLQISLR